MKNKINNRVYDQVITQSWRRIWDPMWDLTEKQVSNIPLNKVWKQTRATNRMGELRDQLEINFMS